ncbi:MAG: hemolysin family protein [Eubacteriales bacterium]|nr:hemolysin family protein [Eubacteriales bacterium]
MSIDWVILILLLAGSAFFSSAETAFTTVNRIQVQLLANEENKQAEKVLWILDHSPKMLSAILIGNNVVNISASALTTTIVIRLFGSNAVGIATGVLTLVVLILGEIFPKTLASTYALRLSLSYSGSIYFIMLVLTPFIWVIELLRRIFLFILKVDPDQKNTMTEDELKELVDVANEEGAIESDEFEMISNVFRLDDSYARDIMVPKPDITFINADISYDEFMEIYMENEYTRYPVYDENDDIVIGIMNVKDLIAMPRDEQFSIRKLMREPCFTFEHKEVGTLLIEMREASRTMVIVLDEYGATSGVITLEDILEEIVGEIHDEFDKNEIDEISELAQKGEYLVEGSVSLDTVNEELGTKLESEQYDTVGGFLIEYLDRLPKSGETVMLDDGTKLIAAIVRKNRVEKVHLILPAKEN